MRVRLLAIFTDSLRVRQRLGWVLNLRSVVAIDRSRLRGQLIDVELVVLITCHDRVIVSGRGCREPAFMPALTGPCRGRNLEEFREA